MGGTNASAQDRYSNVIHRYIIQQLFIHGVRVPWTISREMVCCLGFNPMVCRDGWTLATIDEQERQCVIPPQTLLQTTMGMAAGFLQGGGIVADDMHWPEYQAGSRQVLQDPHVGFRFHSFHWTVFDHPAEREERGIQQINLPCPCTYHQNV